MKTVTTCRIPFRSGIHGVQGVASSNLVAPTNTYDDPRGPLWSHPWSQSEMRVAERRFVRLLVPAAGAAAAYDRTSRDSSAEISNVRILTSAERMKASIPSVDALPTRSQMTFGGAPFTNDRLRKSSSLEITVKLCSRA